MVDADGRYGIFIPALKVLLLILLVVKRRL